MFSDLAQCQEMTSIEIAGQEAHHAARVKRIRTNDHIALIDGSGTSAVGIINSITGSKSMPVISIEIQSKTNHQPISPRIEILAALPKGDRLDRMIDQLSQLGVALYRPLLCQRSQRKPETIRPEKLERIAIEAAKQCRRPYTLDIGDPIPLQDALQDPDAFVADASGHAISTQHTRLRSVILIGPEGGWSETERSLIGTTNTPIIRFGPHVLRIEAAAAAASSIVLAHAVSE